MTRRKTAPAPGSATGSTRTGRPARGFSASRLAAPGPLAVIAVLFLASAGVRVGDPEGLRSASAASALSAAALGVAGLAQSATAAADTGGAAHGAMKAEACYDEEGYDLLMDAIRKRTAALDAREKTIADKERILAVAEARLKEQMIALEETEARLSETLALADSAAENDIANLVAVYEAMKPKNAAPIFETMDVRFAAGFLSRMNKASAASILAGMSAERAYSISVVIAGRNARAPTE